MFRICSDRSLFVWCFRWSLMLNVNTGKPALAPLIPGMFKQDLLRTIRQFKYNIFLFWFVVLPVDRCSTKEIPHLHPEEMYKITIKICKWRLVQETTSNSPIRLYDCFASVYIHLHLFFSGSKKSFSCSASVLAMEVYKWARCDLDAKMFTIWLVFAIYTKLQRIWMLETSLHHVRRFTWYGSSIQNGWWFFLFKNVCISDLSITQNLHF